MPKLPAPPIPPQFLPQPPRPGTQRGRPRTPVEKGLEAGKKSSAADVATDVTHRDATGTPSVPSTPVTEHATPAG